MDNGYSAKLIFYVVNLPVYLSAQNNRKLYGYIKVVFVYDNIEQIGFVRVFFFNYFNYFFLFYIRHHIIYFFFMVKFSILIIYVYLFIHDLLNMNVDWQSLLIIWLDESTRNNTHVTVSWY